MELKGIFNIYNLTEFKLYKQLITSQFPFWFDIWKEKWYPLKVIPLLPLPRLYRKRGLIPGFMANNGCMASDWHP